ncbi:hypothetical protein SNEBB_000718 [Seison nebaliae]|nr:hypothetical protein SNEBB_000718 [Seison nebaliae]
MVRIDPFDISSSGRAPIGLIKEHIAEKNNERNLDKIIIIVSGGNEPSDDQICPLQVPAEEESPLYLIYRSKECERDAALFNKLARYKNYGEGKSDDIMKMANSLHNGPLNESHLNDLLNALRKHCDEVKKGMRDVNFQQHQSYLAWLAFMNYLEALRDNFFKLHDNYQKNYDSLKKLNRLILEMEGKRKCEDLTQLLTMVQDELRQLPLLSSLLINNEEEQVGNKDTLTESTKEVINIDFDNVIQNPNETIHSLLKNTTLLSNRRPLMFQHLIDMSLINIDDINDDENYGNIEIEKIDPSEDIPISKPQKIHRDRTPTNRDDDLRLSSFVASSTSPLYAASFLADDSSQCWDEAIVSENVLSMNSNDNLGDNKSVLSPSPLIEVENSLAEYLPLNTILEFIGKDKHNRWGDRCAKFGEEVDGVVKKLRKTFQQKAWQEFGGIDRFFQLINDKFEKITKGIEEQLVVCDEMEIIMRRGNYFNDNQTQLTLKELLFRSNKLQNNMKDFYNLRYRIETEQSRATNDRMRHALKTVREPIFFQTKNYTMAYNFLGVEKRRLSMIIQFIQFPKLYKKLVKEIYRRQSSEQHMMKIFLLVWIRFQSFYRYEQKLRNDFIRHLDVSGEKWKADDELLVNEDEMMEVDYESFHFVLSMFPKLMQSMESFDSITQRLHDLLDKEEVFSDDKSLHKIYVNVMRMSKVDSLFKTNQLPYISKEEYLSIMKQLEKIKLFNCEEVLHGMEKEDGEMSKKDDQSMNERVEKEINSLQGVSSMLEYLIVNPNHSIELINLLRSIRTDLSTTSKEIQQTSFISSQLFQKGFPISPTHIDSQKKVNINNEMSSEMRKQLSSGSSVSRNQSIITSATPSPSRTRTSTIHSFLSENIAKEVEEVTQSHRNDKAKDEDDDFDEDKSNCNENTKIKTEIKIERIEEKIDKSDEKTVKGDAYLFLSSIHSSTSNLRRFKSHPNIVSCMELDNSEISSSNNQLQENTNLPELKYLHDCLSIQKEKNTKSLNQIFNWLEKTLHAICRQANMAASCSQDLSHLSFSQTSSMIMETFDLNQNFKSFDNLMKECDFPSSTEIVADGKRSTIDRIKSVISCLHNYIKLIHVDLSTSSLDLSKRNSYLENQMILLKDRVCELELIADRASRNRSIQVNNMKSSFRQENQILNDRLTTLQNENEQLLREKKDSLVKEEEMRTTIQKMKKEMEELKKMKRNESNESVTSLSKKERTNTSTDTTTSSRTLPVNDNINEIELNDFLINDQHLPMEYFSQIFSKLVIGSVQSLNEMAIYENERIEPALSSSSSISKKSLGRDDTIEEEITYEYKQNSFLSEYDPYQLNDGEQSVKEVVHSFKNVHRFDIPKTIFHKTHPLLKNLRPISFFTCRTGDIHMAYWHRTCQLYVLFIIQPFNAPLFFINNDCAQQIVESDKAKPPLIFVRVLSKDYCIVKREPNRYRLPVNSNFYRVAVESVF